MTASRRLALRTALALFAVVGLVAALAPSSAWPNLARAHSPGSASLTALTVTAGGAAQTLDPTFSSTEYSYTVSVVNSVAQVTVTATPDGDGTVAYQNTGGTTLTDADTTTAGQQVDLPMVGGTSVNVVVSHTDSGTTTTQTYTVLVIREETAPPSPAIASLTPSDQALTVVWTAPASDGGFAISSYDLRYIATDAEDKADDNWTVKLSVWTTGAGALESTLSGLTNGTRYDVQVRAVNAIDNGSWSTTVSGKAATVPSAPYLGYAVPSNGQVNIVWSSPASDGGSDITSYDLRYIRSDEDDSDDDNWTYLEDFSRTASSYRILGLTNSVAYHMQVRAINAAGDGAWSERVTRTPVGPPGTPSIDTVTPGDASLTITWSPPSSDGGRDITSYNLRYVRNDLVNSNFLYFWTEETGIWTSGDLEYTLSGLDNGVRYRLGLQAVNEKGTSGWSDWNNPRTGTAGTPPVVPGAPTIDRATSDGATVHITWSAPAEDGGADITGYDLRHILKDATDKADGNWTVLQGVWTSGALKYTVEGLSANVQYDFQLSAGNSAGAGSWSATVNNMDPSPPGAPVIGYFSEETPGEIGVSWEPPADDGGALVTHYDLRHIRSDATDKADDKWTQVDDLTGYLNYTIVGLTSRVRYDVQVRAANRAGDGSWSATLTASPKAERPNPPGNISVTPGDGKLTVKWSTAPVKAGVIVTGYKVGYIRSDHPGYNNINNWTTSDLIPSETLEYAITGLQNGVKYTIDAYSISSVGRTSPPPTTLPLDSPGRPPAALGRLKRISTHESSFFISWIGPSDNGAHTVTSYDIHYHRTSDPTNVVKRSEPARDIIEGPSATNNTWVGNLTPHVEYKIQVRARNRIGPGPWSSLTLIPRREPVELEIDSVTEGDGALTVAWTDGGDDEITGYEVRYSFYRLADQVLPDSDDWEYRRNITGTNPLEYTVDRLVNGRWYQVQVRGKNKYGELSSDFSNWSESVSGTPKTVPGALAVSSVTSGDKMLTVVWAAPASNGGSTITSYDLRYIDTDAADKADDANWMVKDSVWTSGALQYDLFGLTNGVAYEVQVRAVNVVDPGPWSPVRTGTAQTTPGMPSIAAVTPGDKTLTVAWAAPARDGGFAITSYDLRYIRSDAPNKADDNWTVKDSVWTSGDLRHDRGGLTNGVDYDVQVRAVTVVGKGPWSGTGAGTPRTTPSAPTIDAVTPGDQALTVAWSAPARDGGFAITSYDLRYIDTDAADKADDDNWTVKDRVWSSGALQYDLSGLINGVAYEVQVRAVNAVDPGPWSPVRTGTAQTTPGMPSIDAVTPGDKTLTVAWAAPARDGGFAITSYDLRYIRSDAPNKADDNWTVKDSVWTSGDLRHDRGGLTNGVDYDVQVRAVTVVGEGPWSGTGAGTPRTTPSAPTIDAVTPGDQALTVAWAAPDDTGGSTITSYDLRYIDTDAADKADDDNWTEQDGIWTSGAIRYTLPGLTNGVGYDVQVRAVNVAGDGRWSGTISGILQTIPAAPTIDTVTHGDETLTIDWSAPSNTGGATVTSYDVHYIRSDAPNKADANWSLKEGIWSSGPRSYDLTGLTNGVRYDVRLRAVTTVGPGPWSAPASATPQTAPDAPTINQVTPGDGALAVSWSSPSDTGGSAITSYDLRYIRSDAPDKADVDWMEQDGIWTAGVLRYTLGSLTNGVEYDVQVRAVNAVDAGPWSPVRTGTAQTTPGMPSIAAVTPGDKTLTVAWAAPARDGGFAITSYDLRYIRSDAANKADANWTVRVDIEISGSQPYALAGLTNGVRYDVGLRAVTSVGKGPWSAPASATPQTAPDAPTINQVTLGDGALAVSWLSPSDTGGSAITFYDLRYIRSDAADKADVYWTEEYNIWTAGVLRYTLSGLTNGVAYEVQVRAVNAVDAGPWSPVRTGTAQTTPGMPSIASVTPDDETLTIAWSPSADDGGSAITSYDVRYIRSDAPDKADANWTVRVDIEISGSQPYALAGLTNGVRYDVGLRAVNAAGDGPWSTISTDTPRAAPGAPTIARITPGERALSITWTAPASDGGFAITSYDLRYIRSDAPDKADDANWREAIDIWIPGDILHYPLNEATGFHNLENSVKYDVQVRAVSRQPQDVPVAGPWSASRTGTPGSVRPPPPSSGGGSSGDGGGGGGGSSSSRATPTPTPTPTPSPTPIPTPTGPQYSGLIAAEPSVTATVVPDGTTLGLNGGGDQPGGVYVNFPPTAVALPVSVSVSVSNTAPEDATAPSGTTLLPLTIDITPETPLTLGEPLTIEINPTPEQLAAAGGDLNNLAVGVVTPNGVVVLPTQVLHGRLVVTIDHLSTFVLVAITDPGPVLTQPPPGDASSMGPLLQWTQPPRTTWFQVQVIPFNEDGPGINLVIGDGALVQAAQYQVMAPNFGSADPNYVLLPDMTYLWRVRTSTVLTNPTEADWSAWAASSFKTPPASSSTITRVAPPFYGEVSTLTPTLTWANSDPAVFYYEVQLSKDFEFGPNAFLYSEYVHGGASTPANSYVVPEAFPLEAGAFYYWRVRPRIQGDGDPLPWSSTYVFQAPPG